MMAPVFTCSNVMRLITAALFLAAIGLTSCSTWSGNGATTPAPQPLPASAPQAVPKNEIIQANLVAGDALSDMLIRRIGSGSGILVTTLVNMENLDQSSAFGRMSMQQIGSRLSQNGFKVIESRLSSQYRMEEHDGEFMLTRDTMRLLAQEYDAHAVLVGFYSVINGRTYISVRVVRFNDNAVVAAYEYYSKQAYPADASTKQTGTAIAGGGTPCDPDGSWARHVKRDRAFQ